jgi:hypothetical protein
MIAGHRALRRDLESLVRAASSADLANPVTRRSVGSGWDVFKRQLHIHHAAEDDLIWPALRERLSGSENALSVLDAMEQEHQQVDPLLAAVDSAFASAAGGADGDPANGGGRLGEVIDPLVSMLTGHLAHEERDALPLIGTALTGAEWRAVGRKIAIKNLPRGPEMFGWMLHDAPPEQEFPLKPPPRFGLRQPLRSRARPLSTRRRVTRHRSAPYFLAKLDI